MNQLQDEITEALAIIVKAAKSQTKLLVEYPLWLKLSYEARTQAYEIWEKYRENLKEGWTLAQCYEMEEIALYDQI